MSASDKNKDIKKNQKNIIQDNHNQVWDIIVEWQEDEILDENLKKILKRIFIWLIWFILLIFIFTYSFFNIKNNFVGITEWFFVKNINVYTQWGIKLINPFNLNIKTTYPLYTQTISFDSKNKDNIVDLKKIYDQTYKADWLRVNTKDEIPITIKLNISYKLKNNDNSIISVYNKSWNGNFIEKIVLPTITSAVSDVYSQYKLIDIVNKSKDNKVDKDVLSLSNILKERIKSELEKEWFILENFTFWWIESSEWITKTIEELFNTQNQLELEKTKIEIVELKNKNALKELELINDIYKEVKDKNISIDDYQKIKMIQIFQDKWNWNIIPSWLNDLIK